MIFFKRFLCLCLSLSLLLLSVTARASDGDEEDMVASSGNIVTEYYSPDLKDPIKIPSESVSTTVAPDIVAKSVILIEASTKTVLYEKQSHERLAPASITKVMSLLLVAEAIDSGQLTVDTVLKASEHACSMGGSQIWLEPGEEMSVHDLLKATVIGSANDATVVLGEALAGSEEGFVSMMNERAEQLGMTDTNFVNCTGLDAEGHLTSAYDIAVMSAELLKYDFIRQYTTVWMDSLRNGESELVNTNKLVRYYEGCTGLKTGTTSLAGACLSASARRNDMEIIAVIMGAANSNERFNGARKLLDYGFANWGTVTVKADEKALTQIKVKGGAKPFVKTVCLEEKTFLVEKSKIKTLMTETQTETTLKAPVEKGKQVGVTRVYIDGKEIGTLKITASESVKRLSFGEAFKIIVKNCFYV